MEYKFVLLIGRVAGATRMLAPKARPAAHRRTTGKTGVPLQEMLDDIRAERC
jgi:hypothetical protein